MLNDFRTASSGAARAPSLPAETARPRDQQQPTSVRRQRARYAPSGDPVPATWVNKARLRAAAEARKVSYPRSPSSSDADPAPASVRGVPSSARREPSPAYKQRSPNALRSAAKVGSPVQWPGAIAATL